MAFTSWIMPTNKECPMAIGFVQQGLKKSNILQAIGHELVLIAQTAS